ncbi:GntR family transcriptional regulator [Xenophilus azovorans]|uniref:GntR family transcriptional regulator n=1 Tax=Xenophilus azovorans TaxID=151755 RepID=UPI00068D5BBC|nr:FCD domain-containing protein [Xenophilus azovorans]
MLQTSPSTHPVAPDSAGAPRTLIETVYRQLRRDIIDGRHAAGNKLRIEHLKTAYGVSGGTLREALALLVSDSLVVSQEQRGFRVAPMSLSDLKDLTRTRILIECEALGESIERGRDEWEAGVVSAFHRLTLAEDRLRADAAGAFDDWEERNRLFHEALVSACQSTWMKRFRELLYQQSERYRRLSALKAPVPADVHDEHQEIFEAVMGRDIDRAKASLANHIRHALEVLTKHALLPDS